MISELNTTLYIYFISDGHGSVKIGIAKDISKRMKQLQCGNPHKLVLLDAFRITYAINPYDVETALHHFFDDDRLEGEWFKEDHVLSFLEGCICWHGNCKGNHICEDRWRYVFQIYTYSTSEYGIAYMERRY